MLKTIVIDDQEFCIEVIRDMIAEFCPDVKIEAVCQSGKEGIKAIKKFNPDLIILDVEMPEMDGFEMLKKIKNPSFEVIFTTSFDKYSIQAIRFSALDYLLKPVVAHELRSAIDRIGKKQNKYFSRQSSSLFQHLHATRRPLNQVALPSSDGLIFIVVPDIIHCESDSNYTTLYLKSKEKIIVTKTLKEVENLLEGSDFFRIHHSHLININHIKKYVRGNAGYVIMSDGSHVNIARNKKDEFMEQFVRL
jgi:two-component system LytT family response regulator